jgi:hypothetical protein
MIYRVGQRVHLVTTPGTGYTRLSDLNRNAWGELIEPSQGLPFFMGVLYQRLNWLVVIGSEPYTTLRYGAECTTYLCTILGEKPMEFSERQLAPTPFLGNLEEWFDLTDELYGKIPR